MKVFLLMFFVLLATVTGIYTALVYGSLILAGISLVVGCIALPSLVMFIKTDALNYYAPASNEDDEDADTHCTSILASNCIYDADCD